MYLIHIFHWNEIYTKIFTDYGIIIAVQNIDNTVTSNYLYYIIYVT